MRLEYISTPYFMEYDVIEHNVFEFAFTDVHLWRHISLFIWQINLEFLAYR